MHSIQFWKSWPEIYQRIGWALALLLFVAIGSMWVWYVQSPAPTVTSFQVQELETQSFPVHTFQKGPFEFSIAADNQLIFERVLGDDLKPNVVAGYIFVTLLAVSLIFLVTIATLLSRFWYIISMILFILLLVSMRLEIVQLFGSTTKVFPIAVLSLLVMTSYFFHALKPGISFLARIISFTSIFVTTALCIILFSETSLPILQVAANSYIAAMILTILFVISVAHEILASFIYVASQSAKQSKSLNHFLIISAIYMVNLLLAYAHKIDYIDWDFLYVDLILLITLSGILGIWGFRLREPQYDRIIVADPFGVYFFISIASLSFGTIGYLVGTANDAALQTILDIILYTHIGFGIIFLTYAISNFIGMLAANQPVYKVLYKPNRMPYFTFRFGGIVATLAFVFYNTWQVPVNNAYGGYHNAKADVYLASRNNKLAEAYYKQAAGYGFLNHHANYALANLEEKKFNAFEARSYYDRASSRRPTEESYLNHSDLYARGLQNLQALFVLQEAALQFPHSGAIQNAMGLAYAKLDLLDSAFYFLQQASDHSETTVMADANFLGLAARTQIAYEVDSILQLAQSNNPGIQSNALALANLQGQALDLNAPALSDTVLNLFTASRFSNYVLNHLGNVDQDWLNGLVALADLPHNRNFSEPILHSCALSYYAEGKVGKAFTLLKQVTINASEKGRFNNTLALWSLEQNAPEVAIEFLRYTTFSDFKDAGPTSAVAFSEASRDEAPGLWDSLRRHHEDTTIQQIAASMTRVLSIGANQATALTDEEKALFCKYRIETFDTATFVRLANSITDSNIRARTFVNRTKKFLELGLSNAAVSSYRHIRGLSIDRALYEETFLLELRVLAALGNLPLLKQRMDNSPIALENHSNEWLYFNARLNEAMGDTTSAASQYEDLGHRNPYDEMAVIAAASFFRRHGNETLKSYNILADALLENPFSVRLLKAYALEAMRNGFDQYALSALERLQPLLPPRVVSEFLRENRQVLAPILEE